MKLEESKETHCIDGRISRHSFCSMNFNNLPIEYEDGRTNKDLVLEKKGVSFMGGSETKFHVLV